MERSFEDCYAEVEERHPWFVARRELFCSLLAGDKLQPVLDVGCGTGMLLTHLKALGFRDLSGVEPSENLRRKFRDPEIPLFAELPERTFAAIFLLDVLEHVEDDRDMLRCLRRLLAPRGRLYLSVPAHPFLWSPHDEVNEHKRRYRRRELVDKLVEAGYELRKLSYWNMFAFPAVFLARALGSRAKTGDLQRGGALQLAILRRLLRLESRLLVRFRLPIGVSLIAVAESATPGSAAVIDETTSTGNPRPGH